MVLVCSGVCEWSTAVLLRGSRHMQPLGIRCSGVLQSDISMIMFSRVLLVLCLCLCGKAQSLQCESLQRDVSDLAHVSRFRRA
jgi:hypothetical protein